MGDKANYTVITKTHRDLSFMCPEHREKLVRLLILKVFFKRLDEKIQKTSKDYKVGLTDADVFILMIGNNQTSSTEWVKLDNFFRDDFELGRVDKFNIKAKDVGLPEVIRLKIKKDDDKNGWLCDTVTVKYLKGEVHFSVYDIILDEIAVRAGPASLPQHDKSNLYQTMRQSEIARNKAMYDWHLIPVKDDLGWDLPRYCKGEEFKDLPLLFQANDVHYDNFKGNREKVLFNLLAEVISGKICKNNFENFDDFKDIFHFQLLPSEMPPFVDEWKKDEEFGRQMISGVNPTMITRCKELPQEFQTDEERIFGDKKTCQKELQAKHLYWISYRGVFDGLRRNTSKAGVLLHCAESICLLLVGSDEEIRPIAIQLEKNGYVFTPKDSEYDWMLAKMYFRNSDSNLHEFQSHLLRTHILIEPMGIALFQCLSRNHPIYKLLRPHLQTVVAINTLGRGLLLGPKASTNFTMSISGLDMTRYGFKNVTFEDLIIPEIFKRNGTDDCKALPRYNYREDSLRLWNAIRNYAGNVVKRYYGSDKDVLEDPEISDFIQAIAEEGIGWAGTGTKGFPLKLHTIEELIQYCTIIIFTSSAQHAASNFGQFEIYKFIPNSPVGMRLPPHKKGEGSMKRILDSLPDPTMSCLQAGVSYTLSSFSPNEIYLGDYPSKFFTDQEVLSMQEDFRKELKEISEAIKKRNENLRFPYEYLLPERIPNSIAV